MSLQDPIADMLTRIRNGQARTFREVEMPASKLKIAIANILKNEGYISDFGIKEDADNKNSLAIQLKYYEGKPVIELLQRYSRPGLRRYRSKSDIPSIKGGLGIAIVSTPNDNGIMSNKVIFSENGSELCEII